MQQSLYSRILAGKDTVLFKRNQSSKTMFRRTRHLSLSRAS